MRSCDACELIITIRPFVFCNSGTAKLRSEEMSANHISEQMITLTEQNCTSRECSLRSFPTTWSGPRLRKLMVTARESQWVPITVLDYDEKGHARWNEGRRVAALATRMSKRPKCATVAATASPAFLTSRTSAGKVSTWAEGRSRRIMSLLASSASCLRATNIRDAPARAKCKVVSRPIPRDAPVIRTTFPAKVCAS